jgi:hypothetical protein
MKSEIKTNYVIKEFDTGKSIDIGTGMIKSPEEPWERRWSTFQVNPYAMLKWAKTSISDRLFRQFGEQEWYEWGLPENTPSTLTIDEIQKLSDPMSDIPGLQSPMDVNTLGSWANLFAKAGEVLKFIENLGIASLQQLQTTSGLGNVDIRLPDYSQVLKKLEERGKEIYETERGGIL